MNNLKRKERILNFKNERIIELENTSRTLQTLLKCLSPFRIIIGVGSLALSLTIVGSLLITTYMKVKQPLTMQI
jgi:LMBR1 domain-containing protein 1